MLEFTAFSANAIAAVPAAPATIATPNDAIPAVPTRRAAPKAIKDVLSRSITALVPVATARSAAKAATLARAPAATTGSAAAVTRRDADTSVSPAPNTIDPAAKANTPAAVIKTAAPTTASAAPTTTKPAPRTIHAAPATAAPAPKTIMPAPRTAIAAAPCMPYCVMTGRTDATTARAALAINAPVATNTMATPKAIIPTAPAVNAGPKAAAPAASSAMAATIPTKMPIARGPALARLIAADERTYIPAPAIKTAAPKAIMPTDAAVSCFPTTEATTINAPMATTIPNIVAIAGAPAFASAMEDCARTAKPALIISTAAPSDNIAVLNAFNFAGPMLILFIITTIPAPRAATAATKLNITAIAGPPASERATADCANR